MDERVVKMPGSFSSGLMGCGGCTATIEVSSRYFCEVCGRMLCEECGTVWKRCKDHREPVDMPRGREEKKMAETKERQTGMSKGKCPICGDNLFTLDGEGPDDPEIIYCKRGDFKIQDEKWNKMWDEFTSVFEKVRGDHIAESRVVLAFLGKLQQANLRGPNMG